MSYPLVDTGYTLWAADLDSALMYRYGMSARSLGVNPKELLHSYYRGVSVSAAVASISERHGLPR
ncbi:MAG: hypothetical protein M0006_13140 [Magnetospirillum sp.]|nr:hypothetical protein [Magnetospirillum sp.]